MLHWQLADKVYGATVSPFLDEISDQDWIEITMYHMDRIPEGVGDRMVKYKHAGHGLERKVQKDMVWIIGAYKEMQIW